MRLFCVVDCPVFSYDVDFDLPRIFHLAFDLFGDVFRKEHSLTVVNLFGFNHDSDFSARLNCVSLVYTLETRRNRFELFEPFYVIRSSFASCARSCSGYSVGSLNQYRFDTFGLYVTVVSLYAVNYVFAFFIFPVSHKEALAR